jgi:Kef-type K+ transport system membrane component KefB
VFLDIAIVIVVARLMGALFRRIRQPAVVGEIVGGILLGPSFLGLFNEDLPGRIFPAEVVPFLSNVAQIGLIIFMFIVGLEVDVGLIRGKGRVAAVTSITSVALPFGLGMLAAGVLHEAYGVVNGEEVEWLHFALFLGASMSVTAFPVLARILTERRMHRTRIGVLALACAAVDDVLAWSLLAAVLAVVGESHLDPQWVVLLTLVYAGFTVLVVRPLLVRVVARYQEVGRLTPDILSVVLVGVLVSAFLTSEIGIHAIFGAFFFGAVFPREGAHQMFHEILERLEQVTVLLLLPVFFVVTGLQVDITGLGADGLGYLALVLLVACTGKLLGAFLGARSQGVPSRQAMALGVLMNTRGLTELVILTVGKEAGVLSDEMFTIMVVMAIFTTVITEPLLRVFYPDDLVDREIAEAERLGSDQAEAFRVLVGFDEGVDGSALAGLAADLTAGEDPREVTLVQLSEPAEPLELGTGFSGPLDLIADSLDQLHRLESQVVAAGVPCYARTRVTDEPGPLLGQLADENVADVVLVPAPDRFAPPSGSQAPAAPTARLAGPRPGDGEVVVALSGGGDDRVALDLGLRLSSARQRPARIRLDAAPNRRLAAVVQRLRERGLVVDDDGRPPVGLLVHAGHPTAAEPDLPTMWVQAGRDDGADRLTALVDRLESVATGGG